MDVTPQIRVPSIRCNRSNITRTRTGCASCKLRRKKCDERKPICRGCERNSLNCTWPNISKVQTPPKNSEPNDANSVAENGDEKVEESAHFKISSERTATTCKEISIATKEVLFSTTNMKVMPASISLRLPSADGAFSMPSTRLLIQYFIQDTANMLCSLTGNNNPFIVELLPIALLNTSVLHAVLTLSGVHYADRVSNSLEKATWSHYSKALQYVNRGITTLGSGENGDEALPLLLTTLLLCFVENARGDVSGSVFHHLRAAKHLLHVYLQQSSSKSSPDVRGFVAEFYSYQAVLADISIDTTSVKEIFIGEDIDTLFSNDVLTHRGSGMLYGCAQSLFQLIPQISELSRRRMQDEQDYGRCSVENLNTYFRLRDMIEQHALPLENVEASFAVCSLLYQQAILVYLETSIRKFELISPGHSSFIENALNKFINLLNSLPVASPICTTLCWPIMVLGSWATSTYHCTAIRQRLEAMSEFLGMGCVRQCQRLLEIIWAYDSIYADSSGIQMVMNSNNLKISFS